MSTLTGRPKAYLRILTSTKSAKPHHAHSLSPSPQFGVVFEWPGPENVICGWLQAHMEGWYMEDTDERECHVSLAANR